MTHPADRSSARKCQWCAEVAAAGATHCQACGAALPLEVPLDDLRIAGVTDVDPELKAYAKGSLRIPNGSPTQAMAGRLLGAAALGGPAAILAAGALAAVAASELRGQRNNGSATTLELGQPSEANVEIARRLQEAQAGGVTSAKPNLLPSPPPSLPPADNAGD